jgi:hypothetical protein
MTAPLPTPYFVASDGVTIVTDKNGPMGSLPVARVNVHGKLKPTRLEPHPTALLFAAAPELLKQLENALEVIKNEYPNEQWPEYYVPEIVAALNKAKGL